MNVKTRIPNFWLLPFFAFFCVAFPMEKPLVLRGAKVLSVGGTYLEGCSVVIEGEKIRYVGPEVKIPEGARILECRDRWIIPGLIDVFVCPTKLAKEKPEKSDFFTPQERILDLLDPAKYTEPLRRQEGWEILKIHKGKFQEAVRSGVTTLLVIPDKTKVVSGLAGIFKLKPTFMDEAVVNESFALKIGVDRKAAEGLRTQMGVIWGTRELFLKRKDALEKKGEKKENADGDIFSRVFSKKLPVLFETNAEEEIARAISLKQEFGLAAIFFGKLACPSAYQEMARENIPVILSSPQAAEADDWIENLTTMINLGLDRCLSSEGNVLNPLKIMNSLIPWFREAKIQDQEIYGLMTSDFAKILGLAHRIGSIEKGKDADLVVLSGDPLKPMAKVEKVIIEGKVIYDFNEKKPAF